MRPFFLLSKYSLFVFFFCLFTVAGIKADEAASPSLALQKWLVAPFKDGPALVTQLNKMGVSADLDASQPVGPSVFTVFEDTHLYSKLNLKNTPLEVYTVDTKALIPLHLMIHVPTLLDSSDEQRKALYNTLMSLLHALTKMGFAHFYLFVDFEKSYGVLQGPMIEIIPVEGTLREGFNLHFVDVGKKFDRLLYGLFQKNSTPSSLDQTLKADLLTHFTYEDHTQKTPSRTSLLPWLFIYTHLSDVKKRSFEMIGVFLQKNKYATFVPLAEDTLKTILDTLSWKNIKTHMVIPFLKTKESCAFCSMKVIQSQYMILGSKVNVLYNYSPYTPEGHFLVIPKEHRDIVTQLAYDEFEEMLEFARKLTVLYFKNDHVIWFLQNGPLAGQTVPHTHLHVLKRPSPPWYLFIEWSKQFLGESPTMYGPKEFMSLREVVTALIPT